MRISVFDNIANKEKTDAVDTLVIHSTPRQDFFLLVILSVLMATIGLLEDNGAIVIGSMLIAPVLYPILGTAMGMSMSNAQLIYRSLSTLVKSVVVAVGCAVIVTLLMHTPGSSSIFIVTNEIALRIHPGLADIGVAIVAGLAASFALVKPQLSETLPGVAISVALVPPLSVFGIGIAVQDADILRGAFILFLLNFLGILFACVMVFSIMNFYIQRTEAKEVIEKEDEKLEKENHKSEKNK